MEFKKKILLSAFSIFILMLFSVLVVNNNSLNNNVIQTNANIELSNQKIEWGIKRGENHAQPDLGTKNKKLIEQYNGLAMGNSNTKYIYMTFDLGYEAGYTNSILDTLKENNVKAAFFITAHYVNTSSDIVQRMIDEGHIVGNHTPKFLMSRNGIEVRC